MGLIPESTGYAVQVRGRGNNAHRNAIARARKRLTAGQDFRRNTREDTWARSEIQYNGNHWGWNGLDPSGQDLIVINLSFSTVNTIVPYVTGSEPNFLVLPYGQGATEKNAAIQQAFQNRLWRSPDVNGQEELETATVDALIYGDGYMKVGYDIVEKRVDGQDKTYADVAEIWVARVDPWDLWIDPTANGIHDARWVCQRLRMTRTELEASGYANIDGDNVEYGPYHRMDQINDRPGSGNYLEAMDGEDYAILYEFYDAVRGLKVVFSTGMAPLQVVEDVPVIPIVQMGNYRIPNSPYHMGELEQLWAIQMELNKTRSQMITHRARNAQKFIGDKNKIDNAALEALKSQEVNALVQVEANGEDLTRFIQPLNVQPLSADVYNMSEILEQDIYEISGVSEYLRGASPTIRKTATEATIIEAASNVKSQYKLKIVERATKKVGTLMLGFASDVFPQTDYEEMQLYLTGAQAELVRNADDPGSVMDDYGQPIPEGEAITATVTLSPDVWIGTYEVLVEMGSTELRSPIVRETKLKERAMDLVGLAPLLAQFGVNLNIKKVITDWLEAAGVEDVDSLFLGGAQPPVLGEPAPEEGGLGLEAELANLFGEDIVASGAPDQFMAPEDGLLDPENTGALAPL